MNLADLAVLDMIRVGAAILAGALIGLEREFRDKSAGFRTLIFIAAGAALFTILSRNLAGDSDPTRIAANIVTGIGFLGAGAILRDGTRIAGLTTAATIWLTAAIGMAFGNGEFLFGGMVTVSAMIVLWAFPPLEHAIDRIREQNTYEVVFAADFKKVESIESEIKHIGLKALIHHYSKTGADMVCKWSVAGAPKNHEKLIQFMMADPEIKEFRY